MLVRAGDRYVERPFGELVIEALMLPFYIPAFVCATTAGWSH